MSDEWSGRRVLHSRPGGVLCGNERAFESVTTPSNNGTQRAAMSATADSEDVWRTMTSDLRLLPPALADRSASDREIVLTCSDALAALQHLADSGHQILGWEGWLRYVDGRLGHSARHQGTADLGGLAARDAVEVCRKTIIEVEAAWGRNPEITGAELLYCITVEPA